MRCDKCEKVTANLTHFEDYKLCEACAEDFSRQDLNTAWRIEHAIKDAEGKKP